MQIIKIGVILVLVVIFIYLGWVGLEKFINASSRRNLNSAVLTTKEIYQAELKFKKIHGKYGKLKDLANSNLIRSSLADGVNDGYKFEIKIIKDDFKIHAIPLKKDGGTRFYLDSNKRMHKINK